MNISIHVLEPEERGQFLRKAQPAQLYWRARSERAKALAEDFAKKTERQEFELGERQRSRNKEPRRKLVQSVLTWTAALIRHSMNIESDGCLYCPCRSDQLKGTLMDDRSFRAIRGTWESLGLFEVFPDCFLEQTFEGSEIGKTRFASRYRATPLMLQLAANYGITGKTFSEHFYDENSDRKVLRLRATSKRSGANKERGKQMTFLQTSKTRKIEKQVRDINSYYSEQRFGGIPSPQLFRGFNNGDDPAFNWNMGGRFYSIGPGSYQNLKSDQRRRISINGQETCEIDIGASHLTLIHGLLQAPLDLSQDPYAIPGIHRSLVKKALVAMLGTGKPMERWPSGFKEQFSRETGRTFPNLTGKQVGQIVQDRFPCLNRMADAALDWSKVQFIEAEILMRVMLCLKNQLDVPALPVHDSLIVQVSAADVCEEELRKAFQAKCGLIPRLTRK